MRAPDFWSVDGLAARLLSPLDAVYGAIARLRLRRAAPRASLPAIVVGGLTAGGDGKTPLVLAIARRLSALGENPALLTRGYGRRRGTEAPLVVDLTRHDASDVGDEALLLARGAMTIVGADRFAGAALAKAMGASVVVLDDGFHSARVAADLSILAIDSNYGAGNGRCLPAGPLRAPLDAQLAAADALVVIGDGDRGADLSRRADKPVFSARIVADGAAFKDARVIAFAGIARPKKFFHSLREAGATLIESHGFADHHTFTARELKKLAARREILGARLVTTEKDAARLDAKTAHDHGVETLPVELVFDDVAAIDAALSEILPSRGPPREASVTRPAQSFAFKPSFISLACGPA
ncbi:MAG: tetraacyldisaccharide 4'-kinase [Methylocystis sp.]|nr:tetraacyldisaccharide 4'-kinase [Methylocystis sp.]